MDNVNSIEEKSIPNTNAESAKASGLQRKVIMIGIALGLLIFFLLIYFAFLWAGNFISNIGANKSDKEKISSGVTINSDKINLQKEFDHSNPPSASASASASAPAPASAPTSASASQKCLGNGQPQITYDVKGNPVVICSDNGSTVKSVGNNGIFSDNNIHSANINGLKTEPVLKNRVVFNRLDVPLGVSGVSSKNINSLDGGAYSSISMQQNSSSNSEPLKPIDPNKVVKEYMDTIKSNKVSTNNNSALNFATNHPVEPNQNGALSGMFQSSKMAGVKASHLGDLNLIFPKGAGVDCVLDGAIDASTSGYVSCTISENMYSANGRTLLAEKGSTAFLEYRAVSAVGQTRFPLIATSIRTPNAITFDLDSGAQGLLGETGASGYVDNRWGERLGAALLVALIGDGITYEIATHSPSGQSSVPQYQQSQGVAQSIPSQVLASTISIKPKILKVQGETVRIVSVRDIDFSSVYKLIEKK